MNRKCPCGTEGQWCPKVQWEDCGQQVKGDDPTLPSPGEAHVDTVSSSGLPSTRAPRAAPLKVNKDDEGSRTSLSQGESERTGPVQPQGEMAERGSHQCLSVSERKGSEDGARLF
ncbi:hypothetical protein TURU_144703 [Turdus rufiventris]|nr:hypothetical protein TURU_144703 [Turdus rufiventris]